jgi:spore coat protein A
VSEKQMKINRRRFIQTAAGGAAFLALRRRAYAFQQSPVLSKFGDSQPLPGLGTNIPVAGADTTKYPGFDYYEIGAGEYSQKMHPNLDATKLWGYVDLTTPGTPSYGVHGYLGPAVAAKKGRPVRIKYINNLPATHPLAASIDRTIPGTNAGEPDNRMAVHLHGGLVPWQYDGGPYHWFTPGKLGDPTFQAGADYTGADYIYPNDSGARLQWFHDHAFGITRINAYTGLAAAYLINDDFEASLISQGLLPDAIGVPLVIQDKAFNSDGSLWYPTVYEKNNSAVGVANPSGRWDYGPTLDQIGGQPPRSTGVIDPAGLPVSLIPEFFADTTLVNGMAYPYVALEPKRYRFRILNGSQARFYNLQLYYEDPQHPGEATTAAGPRMIQVGTEAGFLPRPVVLNSPPKPIAFDTNKASPTFGNAIQYNLLLSPAERADILIDFSGCQGKNFILYNDAPAPFPGGDSRNNYFTGDGDQTGIGGAPNTVQGFGPNTQTLLQIRVSNGSTPPQLSDNDLINKLTAQLATQASTFVVGKTTLTKDLTLNEDFDDYGRLIQMLGTNVSIRSNNQGVPTFSRTYEDSPTEIAHYGDVQVWRIANLTGDTHPIHFHLVNVKILGRQPFEDSNYNGSPLFKGSMRPPDANEAGWKETVRMNPHEVTTVVMQFARPRFSDKAITSAKFTGYHSYVWHCHILEHEEHDMMRPLLIVP